MFKTSFNNSSRQLFALITSKMATGSAFVSTVEKLKFDNLALRCLPIDPQTEVYPRQVPGACFSRVDLTPIDNPLLVAFSSPALELLDIDEKIMTDQQFVEYFSGNKVIPGSEPSAHCYCGHQFGSFAGQLGDGATMYLGEIMNHKGERWELQFKGAGLTPYSRTADGRKVLRSSVREFLCSEAMHHLGVPTTRAGTCITSDSRVVRDIFYNGNPIRERCTVITRIAPTFLRFGSFEIFKAADPETGRKGPSHGRVDILDGLLDYTISTFYPEIDEAYDDRKTKLLAFFTEVVIRTAKLVAHWQCVGFCHGVLNTDNMSIVGLTIDYGPYGFMDRFDPDFICNASDDGGRYTYAKQPDICKWNLRKLAEAIAEAVPVEDTKAIVEDVYDDAFKKHYNSLMAKKLGLMSEGFSESLVTSLMDTMKKTGADFTNSFRVLSHLPYPSSESYAAKRKRTLEQLLEQCCSVEELKKSFRSTMDPRQLQMLLMMAESQPMFLAMMGMEGKLRAELEKKEKLESVQNLTEETKRQSDEESWSSWLAIYEQSMKTDMEKIVTRLTKEAADKTRFDTMISANPRFILRNWVAQNAIAKAENGDYAEVQNVLSLLESPYDDDDILQESAVTASVSDEKPKENENGEVTTPYKSCSGIDYSSCPPDWAGEIRVT